MLRKEFKVANNRGVESFSLEMMTPDNMPYNIYPCYETDWEKAKLEMAFAACTEPYDAAVHMLTPKSPEAKNADDPDEISLAICRTQHLNIDYYERLILHTDQEHIDAPLSNKGNLPLKVQELNSGFFLTNKGIGSRGVWFLKNPEDAVFKVNDSGVLRFDFNKKNIDLIEMPLVSNLYIPRFSAANHALVHTTPCKLEPDDAQRNVYVLYASIKVRESYNSLKVTERAYKEFQEKLSQSPRHREICTRLGLE